MQDSERRDEALGHEFSASVVQGRDLVARYLRLLRGLFKPRRLFDEWHRQPDLYPRPLQALALLTGISGWYLYIAFKMDPDLVRIKDSFEATPRGEVAFDIIQTFAPVLSPWIAILTYFATISILRAPKRRLVTALRISVYVSSLSFLVGLPGWGIQIVGGLFSTPATYASFVVAAIVFVALFKGLRCGAGLDVVRSVLGLILVALLTGACYAPLALALKSLKTELGVKIPTNEL